MNTAVLKTAKEQEAFANALAAAASRKTLRALGYKRQKAGPYERYLAHVYLHGEPKGDRTGTGTLSVFGPQFQFDLGKGIPLITTKKVHVHAAIVELLWFLRGDSNVRWLQERRCTIWDEWADENGDLGPVYGVQWRSWPTPDGGHIDQIAEIIKQLKADPDSRRIIVSAWNVADLKKMALAPCHAFFQFYVKKARRKGGKRRLCCKLTQRSADSFLGVPFNLVSYALLVYMIAQQCDLDVGDFIWSGGDCHIYSNHMNQVETQLGREARPLPTLVLKRKPASIFDYDISDFEFVGYNPHPHIPGKVAK